MPRPRSVPRYPTAPHSSGQARIRVAGRDYYLGKFGSADSLKRFEELLAEFRVTKLAPLPASHPRSMTVAVLVDRYLHGHCREYYADGQRYTRIETAVRSFASCITGAAASLAGPDLKVFQRHLVGAGLSRATINARVNIVRRAFRWALSECLVPAAVVHSFDAVENLHAGRTAAPESVPVMPADESAIAAASAMLPAVLRDMVAVQLHTGMRPGEVCRIRPCDINRTGTITLPRQSPIVLPGAWVYTPEGHKNSFRGHLKLSLIGKAAQAILLPYLDRDPVAWCFSPAESEAARRAKQRAGRKTPVWPSQAARYAREASSRSVATIGDRYTPEAYCRAIARACVRAKCSHWHPHQLRHNAATRLAAEFGDEVARVVLGHRTSDVTRRYISDLHRVAEMIERDRARLSKSG